MEEKNSGIETRSLEVEIRALSDEDRIVEYVASTRGVDRYRTRVIGWDLRNYVKNPVVLWAHNKMMPPVGRGIHVREEDEQLRAQIQFAKPETFGFADTVYRLTRDGFLKGISAGFQPGKKVFNKEMKAIDLMNNELIELSTVPVPGNADALTLALRDGLIPDDHTDLMMLNHAMSATEIRGIENMDELRANVMNWIETAEPVQVQVPVDLEDREVEEEKVDDFDTDQRITALTAESAAQKAVIRTIAALIDFDLQELRDDNYDVFLESVQEATERAGAVLNRANRTKLTQAKDLIDAVVASAEKPADETPIEPEVEADAPDDEEKRSDVLDDKLAKINARMDEVLGKVTEAEHRAAGRELVGKNTEGARHEFIDSLLDRLPKS